MLIRVAAYMDEFRRTHRFQCRGCAAVLPVSGHHRCILCGAAVAPVDHPTSIVAKGTAPTDIKVVNPGVLEIPEDKTFLSTPINHFVELAKSKGAGPIQKAISNLIRWNKGKGGKKGKIAAKAQKVSDAIKTRVTEAD